MQIEYEKGDKEKVLKEKSIIGMRLVSEHTNSDGSGHVVYERDLEAEIDKLKARLAALERTIK